MMRNYIIALFILVGLIGSTIYKAVRHHQKAEAGESLVELMRKGNEVSQAHDWVALIVADGDPERMTASLGSGSFYLWRSPEDKGPGTIPEYAVRLEHDDLFTPDGEALFSNKAGTLYKIRTPQE